jgi:hypothetical protein
VVNVDALREGDPQLREQFIASSGPLLRDNPGRTIPRLCTAAAPGSQGVTMAIKEASRWKPETWVASLGEEASGDLLELTRVCGWKDWFIQQVVVEIARRHPRAVLGALVEDTMSDTILSPGFPGLSEPLGDHPQVLAEWMADLLNTAGEHEWRLADLLPVALGRRLTPGAAIAVERVVARTEPNALPRLVQLLHRCDGLVLAHPHLVQQILERLGTDADPEVVTRVRRSLIEGVWSPHPSEHVAQRDTALLMSEDEALSPTARTLYEQVAKTLQETVDRETQRARDDDA